MGHSYVSCIIHYTFSTKERRPILAAGVQDRLWAYIGGIARRNGMNPIAVGGAEDHAHVLVSLPSALAVAKGVQLVKGGSSKWAGDELRLADFQWQDGYGAFSVSVSGIGASVEYIQNQLEHHRKVTFQEEFLAFLRKHGIQYDPRYVWG